MLKIGEFAKLGYVSVQALRHYDQLGLLRAKEVDDISGYRYYALEQLSQLHQILALKDLGLSLEQIGELLRDGLTEAQISAMLRLKQVELKQQLEERQAQLLRVEARLRLVTEAQPLRHEVSLKSVQPFGALTAQADLPSFGHINDLFFKIDAFIERYGVKPGSSCLGIFREPEKRREGASTPLHIEVATPVSTFLQDDGDVHYRVLPGLELVATVLHQGSYDSLHQAYQSLFAWTNANGYNVTGSSREVYLRFADIAKLYPDIYLTKDPNDFVTEVQLPIAKISTDI